MDTNTPRNAGRTAAGQLCCDDVIRTPRTRRFVRVERVEKLEGAVGYLVHARYMDTGVDTLVVLGPAARPTRFVA